VAEFDKKGGWTLKKRAHLRKKETMGQIILGQRKKISFVKSNT